MKRNSGLKLPSYSTSKLSSPRSSRLQIGVSGAFTSDMALLTLYYLVVMDITKKWTLPLRNWPLTMSQL